MVGADARAGSIVWAASSCGRDARPLPGVVVVPSSQSSGCWSCGAGLPTTGYFSGAAFHDGRPYAAAALPRGHLVRVTTHWLRPPEYRFVADDGTTVPLHALDKFWCIASNGGP